MTNYIYTPNQSSSFKCKVPLENARQLFVVDGKLQDSQSTEGDIVLDYIMPFQSEGGYLFKLDKGQSVDELLQIISVRSSKRPGGLNFANKVELGQSSNAKLLLCSHTLGEVDFQTEEDFNIEIGENAGLDLVIMQNEHNNSLHRTNFRIDMAANARLKLHLVTLHGGEISNNVSVNLNGKGAECEVYGLYLASGEQRITNVMNLAHNVPECHSRQLFKGILDGHSVTHFSGTILVAKDAQKTEAYQSNNNLIVSDFAKAYTQPHLEIYADDVKCSHGATVGSLNEDELFYMRSRGISLSEAKLLQQQAFAYAALAQISKNSLLDRLTDLVERRLRGEFANCRDCSRHSC